MKIVHTKSELRGELQQQSGRKRGLVPTMGALHEGHLSLIDQAKQAVGEDGFVVVTIFVNPTQFGENEDLDAYPRQLECDATLCEQRGVDLIYAPDVNDVYSSDASITVRENRLSTGLCGSSRPGHFDGVCLVVAKLFNLVQPDLAVFGEKDYQQLAVIQRMVRDLDFPIDIIKGTTVREPDGLAMSSRNAYLNEAERNQAPVIREALIEIGQQIEAEWQALSVEKAKDRIKKQIETASLAKIDYLEIVHPSTLEPITVFSKAAGYRIIVAVFFGTTRLIDNYGS